MLYFSSASAKLQIRLLAHDMVSTDSMLLLDLLPVLLFCSVSDSTCTVSSIALRSCVAGPLQRQHSMLEYESGKDVLEECLASNFGEEPIADGERPHADNDDHSVVHATRIGSHIGGAARQATEPIEGEKTHKQKMTNANDIQATASIATGRLKRPR